ncbi:MAG: AAA family ATPase [Patescibacteria group bacterium]
MSKIKPKKLIIGLVGEIASGKDTMAAYLKKKYGAEVVSFSKPLRDILDRMYLPQTRENMVWLGYDLRARFGQDILAKIIGKEILGKKSAKGGSASGGKMFVLPNVRLEGDITYLKKIPGFYLVRIDADQKIRYERLKKRSQNADDKTKTWKQFLQDANLPTEKTIRGVAKKAKFRIDNNGSFGELYEQVEKLIKKIKK